MVVKRNKSVREGASADVVVEQLSLEKVDALDGCDIKISAETLDEDLPPTEGGVA